jgi:hypothetical protein
VLDKMWYIFFATGELTALQAAFELAGNQKASPELINTSMNMFDTFKAEYQKKINSLSNDPNYFKNHKNPLTLDNSKVFDEFDRLLSKTTESLDDSEIATISESLKYKINDELIPKKSEPPINKKLIEGSKLFDELADEIMNKVKIRKS